MHSLSLPAFLDIPYKPCQFISRHRDRNSLHDVRASDPQFARLAYGYIIVIVIH
jgi:hypothetical protein